YSAVAAGTTGPAAPPAPLAADGFDAPALASSWKPVSGTWAQAGGVVRQTGTAGGDPKKLVAAGSFPAAVVVTAKVRVDRWTDRAGGAPALNGGSNAGATASFDDFGVVNPNPAGLAAPTGVSVTATMPGALRLGWSRVAAAASYLIERSPDGTSGWVQITDV